MVNSEGSLSYEAFLKNSQFRKAVTEITNDIRGISKTADKETQAVEQSFRRLGQIAASAFAFSSLAQLPNQLIQVRGEFQQLEVAYKTMLGSKERADKLMADVVKFAATTPFDLKGVASASKLLLAYGFAAEDTTKILTRLGDISSGLNIPLGELTELYGKTKVEGRVMAEDLNQYVGRGIPLIKLLAEQFKVAESEVRGLVTAGRVGFNEIEKAIIKLTDKGGMFAGLMEEQSKGLLGLYSNFEDTIEQAFNKIGKEQEGVLADSIRFATTIVENYEPIIDGLKVIVAGYGAYKAAIIATAAIQSFSAAGGTVKLWFDLAKGIRSAADAQALFNLTTKSNPYGLAAAALVTLITSVALFRDEVDDATKAQQRSMEIQSKYGEKLAEETAKIEILKAQITDETRTRAQRNEKLKELIAISPTHLKSLNLENIATDKGTTAIREYTKALEKKLAVQAKEEEIVSINKRISGLGTGQFDEEFQPNIGRRILNFLEGSGLNENRTKQKVEQAKEAEKKALEKRKADLLKQIASGNAELDKAITAPATSTGRATAIKAAAKEEKEIRVKTYQEMIDEQRNLYMLYERWVETYGTDSANQQFDKLLANGQNYVDFLTREIARLEAVRNADELTVQERFDLDNLVQERNSITGKQSGLDEFNQQLQDAQDNSETLTEALRKVQTLIDSLGTPKFTQDFTKLNAAVGLRTSLEKDLNGMFNSFLVEANANGAKVLQVEKKYIELAAEARKKFKGEELKGALKAIDTAKEVELEAIKEEEFEKSASYKKLNKELIDISRSQLRQRIRDIEEALKSEKMSIKQREQLEKNLADTRKALNKNTAAGLTEAANILNSVLGDASLKISETFAISVNEISQAVGSLGTIMDSGASTTDQVGSFIQLISFTITSARDAMLKASDLATAMDAQVEQYDSLANSLAGVNYLLERQKLLLEDLQGVDRAESALELYDRYAKQQEDALKRLKELSVETIESQKEVFVDPVFNTTIENKGFKGFWTQLMTGGQAKTKIEYEFSSINTAGFDDIEDYVNLLAEIKAGGGKLYGKEVVESDIKALETLIETYNGAVAQQKALMEELKTYYTGTTQEQIADSLVKGFIEGKKSAADFADDFESMMFNAINNSLKANLLDSDMKAFYNKFSEYSLSDFTLTEAEIAELKALYSKIVEEGQKKSEQIEKITGKDLNSNSGSVPRAQQGTITGASQEAINILNGQINAMRVIESQQLDAARSQLFVLTAIQTNTGNTAQNTAELYAIRRDISAMLTAMRSDPMRAMGG